LHVAGSTPSNVCLFLLLQMVTRTKKIFVGGLSAPTTLEDVKNYFEQFGPVSTQHLYCVCVKSIGSINYPPPFLVPNYYRVHNKPPPGHILSQLSPARAFPLYLFSIYFNIIIASKSRSLQFSHSLQALPSNACICSLPRATCPVHLTHNSI
jgi:RNA recognition motif-containing protein